MPTAFPFRVASYRVTRALGNSIPSPASSRARASCASVKNLAWRSTAASPKATRRAWSRGRSTLARAVSPAARRAQRARTPRALEEKPKSDIELVHARVGVVFDPVEVRLERHVHDRLPRDPQGRHGDVVGGIGGQGRGGSLLRVVTLPPNVGNQRLG